MIKVDYKKVLTAMLAGLLAALLISGAPVKADDETSTDAEVEVLPAGAMSYGARVAKFHSALLPRLALKEPDGWSTFIFRNGWISIELENKVPDANMISIWAANRGWRSSYIKIYLSADGKKWKQAGSEKVKLEGFLRYDFIGSFGDVKYIKVERSGGLLSWLRLDALGAKGGD